MIPQFRQIQKTNVCYFICNDQQPFDTINDNGFRLMLHVFDPHYVPLDRKTIASNHILALYDDVKAHRSWMMLSILVLPLISGHLEPSKAT